MRDPRIGLRDAEFSTLASKASRQTQSLPYSAKKKNMDPNAQPNIRLAFED